MIRRTYLAGGTATGSAWREGSPPPPPPPRQVLPAVFGSE